MLNIEEFADTSELFDGRYALIRPLSVDGATADVWLALDTNTVTEEVQLSDIARLNDDEIEKLGLMVAIKIYRPQNALDIEGEQRFRDEFMIVYNCNHTNLLHPTYFSVFKGTPYLVLPYCKFGSAELLIGNEFEEKEIWKLIHNVASGLAYLHAKKPPIIHQDIKPANILLVDSHNYAITDFGISSQIGGPHTFLSAEENGGTLAYMAPERFLEGSRPTTQSDIWAFGATLCEIFTGKVPFGEEGGLAQVEKSEPMPKIPNIPAVIQKLIHECLQVNPDDRPSASSIIELANTQQYVTKNGRNNRVFFYSFGAVFLALLISFGFSNFSNIYNKNLSTTVINDTVNTKKDTANTKKDTAINGNDPIFDYYLSMAMKNCDIAEDKRGDPTIIQVLLDAKCYYYDSAQNYHKKLYGERLKPNSRIDKLVTREYKYWLNRGDKEKKIDKKKQFYHNAFRLRETLEIKGKIKELETKIMKSKKAPPKNTKTLKNKKKE